LRQPSSTTAEDILDPDGANLATVLARIKAETATSIRPGGALAEIGADLGAVVPGVWKVDVEEDRRNHQYRAVVTTRDEPPFSASVVSDGTLRILALLAVLHNPKHRGLVCFEEPENGVHPERLRLLVERLQELVADPTSRDADGREPLTQLLLNSHSPVVLASLPEGRVAFADMATRVDPLSHTATHLTRVRPVRMCAQHALELGNGQFVTRPDVERYLASARMTV
jgi:predicted ATPase